MRIEVKFSSQTLLVELPDDPLPTLSELKSQLHALTNVPPDAQKLLGKPKLNLPESDPKPLSSLGIGANTKLMLLGAPVAELQANSMATAMERRKEIERERLFRLLPLRFWRLPSFSGLLADAFVDGCGAPLESGNAALALLSMDAVLARLCAHRLPPVLAVLPRAHACLRRCLDFAHTASMAQNPTDILPIVRQAVSMVNGLAVGDWLMLPSGWVGLGAHNVAYLLIQRRSALEFALVFVNRGMDGQSYHPTWQTAEGLRVCPFLRLDHVASGRMLDADFWLVLLSLWMRANRPDGRSEFVRAEVMYDVLLPWLLERGGGETRNPTEMLLRPNASTKAQAAEAEGVVADVLASNEVRAKASEVCFNPWIHAHGASPVCSESSAIKGAVSAFVFLLEQFGVTSRQAIKDVKYVLRYELFARAAMDLMDHARRFTIPLIPESAAPTPQANREEEHETDRALDHEWDATSARTKAIATALESLRASGVDETAGGMGLEDILRAASGAKIVLTDARGKVLPEDYFVGRAALLYCAGMHDTGAEQLAKAMATAAPRLAANGAALLFVTRDESHGAYTKHTQLLSMARTAFPADALVDALDAIRGTELLVFASDGKLVHRDGLAALRADPTGSQFPKSALWRGISRLTATDTALLRFGAALLAHHTRRRSRNTNSEESDWANALADRALCLVEAVLGTIETLPVEVDAANCYGLVPVSSSSSSSSALSFTFTSFAQFCRSSSCSLLSLSNFLASCRLLQAPRLTSIDVRRFPSAFGWFNADLLPVAPTTLYYGNPLHTPVPHLEDLREVRPCRSMEALVVTLQQANKVVNGLWERARQGGTASRVALQLHIVELISWLFTEIVPIPAPLGEEVSQRPPEESDVSARFYAEEDFPILPSNRDAQATAQECVYALLLSYANAWQAVECPTRAFDAERCLVGMAILVVYDALARSLRGGQSGCRLMANLLCSNDGYFLSTTVGRHSLPFASASATLELVRPRFLLVRSAILRYIAAQKKYCARELFDLRMPEKFELRKSGTTVEFLRRLLDVCSYRLSDAGGGMAATSEMELLMQWFCSHRTPLAREHPEFSRLRDVVLLAKFLATMEMRESQLLRRRKQLDEFATWRLTFDEDTPGRQMSAGWRTRPIPPQWECVLVRGRDADIADIVVKGFGDRELTYGDGLVLQSPIDVAAMLECSTSAPTEDDVLHATALPSFGGAIGAEEAELLLSCLTAPYVRVPLVLDFFASQDRYAYLFTPQVQAVLRAVLFEPAAFVPPGTAQSHDVSELPSMVPMRLNEQQREEIAMQHLRGDFSRRDDSALLGTSYGLLLNELCHSPVAVLDPLQRILRSVVDLGPSSVYSANASYMLFLVGVMADVLAFCVVVREQGWSAQPAALVTQESEMISFLLQHIQPVLHEWTREAIANNDTPTQCVVHSYLAIIHRTAWRHPPQGPQQEAAHIASMGIESGINLSRMNENEELDTAALHVVPFLESCAFVRARHSFGMGMQRSQLAAQADDSLLSAEERLLRFLQAQGLDTGNISRERLEEGRQLMLAGGRRRAVFVQIRSRQYNDTVRVPNLVRSDAASTTESKQLRLPPADVPENVLFHYLLEDYQATLNYLQDMTLSSVSVVMRRIVNVVLGDRHGALSADNSEMPHTPSDHDRNSSHDANANAGTNENIQCIDSNRAPHWEVMTPGVYRGPSGSGLLFHVQSCELFWRNDELKPVPDSMSHFADFETVLGPGVLQCGLLSRHQNRHWVRVVGTPFDLVEWTAPSHADQGVHCPLVLRGDVPQEAVLAAVYESVVYDRPVDITSETPWPVEAERWAVELISTVMREVFPGGEVSYLPLAPQLGSNTNRNVDTNNNETVTTDVTEMRFLVNDAPQYPDEVERTTWKEIVVYRFPTPHLHVFNLTSHGRRMYRAVVYTSDQRYSLHSLAPVARPRRREQLHRTAFQAGEFTRRVRNETSLEIFRHSASIGTRERFVPARLLQGVVPGVLLEAFLFWQDDNDMIRGYPIEADDAALDYWFHYAIEIQLRPKHGDCVIWRRDDGTYRAARRKSQRANTEVGKGSTQHVAESISPSTTTVTNPEAGQQGKSKEDEKSMMENEEDEEEEEEAQVERLRSALPPLRADVCRWMLRRCKGDVATAIAFAADPANRQDIEMQLQQQPAQSQEAADTARNKARRQDSTDQVAPISESDGRSSALVLLHLSGSRALRPLLRLLVRVEDCSHILVWARYRHGIKKESLESEHEASIMADVVAVELPRLRAKFRPVADVSTGEWRLHLADHPGWFLAEAKDTPDALTKSVAQLQRPFPQSLLLANSTRDFALMVPNHDFTPMRVEGDPFTARLLFDRASLRWQESVASPFYLYAVHPCGGFLTPPSLAASLYYAVMQCATHNYTAAMRTLASCYTDSSFSGEENFMFALMSRTLGDRHPDAHAVRLKLVHAVQYGPQEAPFSTHVELAAYLTKKRHVSRECQLSQDELLDLLRRCTRAPPIVRAQLELWAALARSPASARLPVALSTPMIDRCGAAWERLLVRQWRDAAPRRPVRVTFKPPKPESLIGEEIVKFLWQDTLLADEESGANNGLGFYFLYALSRGGFVAGMDADNASGSLATLLTRWFHLRHSRWGRSNSSGGDDGHDSSDDSERPPWGAAVLRLASIAPQAAWPPLIQDVRALYHMRVGTSLQNSGEDEGAEPVPTSVTTFFNTLERIAREVSEQNPLALEVRGHILQSQCLVPSQRSVLVYMWNHLVPRPMPSNCAMERLRLPVGALESFFTHREASGQQSLAALLHVPLTEADTLTHTVESNTTSNAAPPLPPPTRTTTTATGEVVCGSDSKMDRSVPSEGLSQLPFDLRKHPLCSTPLAQHMLDRLEEDAARFATQQQQQVRRSIKAISSDRLKAILFSDSLEQVSAALVGAVRESTMCIDALAALSDQDAADVRRLTDFALHLANSVEVPFSDAVRTYRLGRIDGSQCAVTLEWLLSALLSSNMDADLHQVNPFHGDASQLRGTLVLLMLLANRSFMAQQASQAVRQIVLFLDLCAMLRGVSPRECSEESESPSVTLSGGGMSSQTLDDKERITELLQRFSIEVGVRGLPTHNTPASSPVALSEELTTALEGRLKLLADAAIDLLTAGRHYMEESNGGDKSEIEARSVELDPRFLLFEFIHSILLRPRQVEMVRWFVDNARRGVSRVQQMIMGQGKTTVVGPLLALILADGEQLVTQVMPTALLEQTRGILRRCFSVVVPKQIYTLQFDRSFDDTDTSAVELLRQKLTAAVRTRAILISAPECIKSALLKSIEQMHMMEATPTHELNAAHDASDERVATRAKGLLRRTLQRSAMADAITPIVQLWQRGVLIMDEVDVLLHPLRSELNFPIGLKHPIDLSGARWALPIHLLNAIFFYQCRRIAALDGTLGKVDWDSIKDKDGNITDAYEDVDDDKDEETVGTRFTKSAAGILQGVRSAIEEGYETRALQREPHLVLLDMSYYERRLLPALLPWAMRWVLGEMRRERESTSVSSYPIEQMETFLRHAVHPGADSPITHTMNSFFGPRALQLVNLAHDWLHRLLPHVLAKIDRVSFGLLRHRAITLAGDSAERMPLSRRLMAIPFVAKDVPSRSSEFAHPDVVIGLTVLAFRYEGMRYSDLRELLLQLKQDFARQSGPKEHRPAARLYHHWLSLSLSIQAADHAQTHENLDPSQATDALSCIPLSQLQVTDEVALRALHRRLRFVPEVVHYYLCSHVFPRTMNFQAMKISACGHELGSSMLFTTRIGFSGTPSNLLPHDLGECFYEPGSDGRVLSVLTNPSVTSAEALPPDWTPLRLLDRIAAAQNPPYHALIDAGALITNMENDEVARYLLARLPPSLFDGVVFLDASDRQMILQRSNGLMVPVAQSGIALNRRFTFFDQVHTTGTDVKQAASVTAVVTLGKDLVFRDYAQGAYRMRGVGKGQRLRLYLIPEVLQRITVTLGSARSGDLLRDVPAWLLLNSVQMEALQFIKLTTQEVENVWRKKALRYLLADSIHANTHPDLYNDMSRCRRFHMERPETLHPHGQTPSITTDNGTQEVLPSLDLLRDSICEFREPIAFPISSTIDTPVPLLTRLTQRMDAKPQALLASDAASFALLRTLMDRLASMLRAQGDHNAARGEAAMHLDAEVVHEQEAEEEQEQQAQQEEQRITVGSRDDEAHIPWDVKLLHTHSTDSPAGGSCFYPICRLRVRPQQPPLLVDPSLQVSDNYHRETWHGMGERRLKNAFLFMEWMPNDGTRLHSGLVTLAEGESLRWIIHHFNRITSTSAIGSNVALTLTDLGASSVPFSAVVSPSVCTSLSFALRVVGNGHYMDSTAPFAAAVPRALEFLTNNAVSRAPVTEERDGAALVYRFFNNDMFYSSVELAVLQSMLRSVAFGDRLDFFTDCLRARRRHRHRWDDAPVAELFVPNSERSNTRPLAILSALRARLDEVTEPLADAAEFTSQLQSFHTHLAELLSAPDAASTTSVAVEDFTRLLHTSFTDRLRPFSPEETSMALRFIATRGTTQEATRVELTSCIAAIPSLAGHLLQRRLAHAQTELMREASSWPCVVCTLMNDASLTRCAACETRRPDAQKETADTTDAPWPCPQCTFINASRTALVCRVCLAPNPSPMAEKGKAASLGSGAAAWECPPGCWVCSVEHGGCSKFNPNEVFYCQVCDKARPNLASLRF